MDTTPTFSRFDDAYKSRSAPWVIGEPQPAIVELERAGQIRGKVLDVGCGTGEHTILLTRLGYDVLGIDFSPRAVEQARQNAAAKGVDARFEVADALNLGDQPTYDTIVDSALFHIFDDADRPKYVASLHGAGRPGATVHVLALSDAGRGFGPEVSEAVIREAFGRGWVLEALDTTTYRGVVQEVHADALGLPVGTVVDEPAWLATARHIPGGRS
jgi:SAM-dependent methyltransferase